MLPFCLEMLHSIAFRILGLHDKGLIHRDIKELNALFEIGGGGKLTDYELLMEETVKGLKAFANLAFHLKTPDSSEAPEIREVILRLEEMQASAN